MRSPRPVALGPLPSPQPPPHTRLENVVGQGARCWPDGPPFSAQIFPLSPGPRWQSSSARPAALALQQALGRELAHVRQGSPEVPGVAVRLLQALATLLSSPHGGALALAMNRGHILACPLMRQLCQYQVGRGGPRRLARPVCARMHAHPCRVSRVTGRSCTWALAGRGRGAQAAPLSSGWAPGLWPCLSRAPPPQRCAPQDTGSSSLFLKVLVQALQDRKSVV